ncbi:ybbO, partial [Symbiodinium sp. KB8]
MKVFITGANRGIGLEYVSQLMKQGAEVWAACRKPSEELQKLAPKQIIEGFDVSDEKSIEKAAQEVGDVTFDVLLNNAGILERDSLDALDFESMKKQFD